MVEIVFWRKPGRFVSGLEEQDRFILESQFGALEDALIEANVALNMFNRLDRSSGSPLEVIDRSEREMEERWRLTGLIEKELFQPGEREAGGSCEKSWKEYDAKVALVQRKVSHEMWKIGYLPKYMQGKDHFICAKSFIHALDVFQKVLRDLRHHDVSPLFLEECYEEVSHLLPDLRDVRDSIQHVEDRVQGKRRNKKIDIKEIFGVGNDIQGKALSLNNLHGNTFCTTMANGEYGQVSVSLEVLLIIRNTLVKAYSAFSWSGGECYLPE